MVFNCWLVFCLSVTELFAGIHFRWKGGGGDREGSIVKMPTGMQVSFCRVEIWSHDEVNKNSWWSNGLLK